MHASAKVSSFLIKQDLLPSGSLTLNPSPYRVASQVLFFGGGGGVWRVAMEISKTKIYFLNGTGTDR